MDDARRAALKAELDDMTAQRDKLNVYIDALSERLGITASSPSDVTPESPSAGQLPSTNDPSDLVYSNEFYGLTMPKAAEAILRRWSPDPYHRPIKTPVLMKALQKGGFEVTEVRVVYRSLWNSSRFKSVKGGQWGLKEWYPSGQPSKAKAKAEDPETDETETDETDSAPRDSATVTDLPSRPGEGFEQEEVAAS